MDRQGRVPLAAFAILPRVIMDPARTGIAYPADHVEQRSFAGAGFASDSEELTTIYAQIDILQSLKRFRSSRVG